MGRPKKLKIKLTSESLTDLLQESYSQLAEQRNIALRQYNSQTKNIKQTSDIALVGKTNAELLKIIDSSIEKKISIARLLKDIVYRENNDNRGNDGELSVEERKLVFEAINREGSNVLKEKLEKSKVELDYGNLSDDTKSSDSSEDLE